MLVVFEHCLRILHLFLKLFLNFLFLFQRSFTRLSDFLLLFALECSFELVDILGQFGLFAFEFGDGLALFL
jgi:hypothetical protein